MQRCKVFYSALFALLLVGCAQDPRYTTVVPEVALVQGSLTFQRALVLPAHAMVTVTLTTAETAGRTPPQLLSQITFLAAGQQPPLPFNLPYALTQVAPHQRMQLSARVEVEGKLWFKSPLLHSITPSSRGEPVTLHLEGAHLPN